MNFLNQHHQETVATMAGERMYVEDIFKEVIENVLIRKLGLKI